MDISTLRLGMAHGALRLALGDELSPISFAQGSFAFIDRRDGKRYFCSADNSALPIFPVLAEGVLGDANDPACLRMRAKAEPAYLAAWSSFARDFDRASSTEARAQARAAASRSAPLSAAQSDPIPELAPATPSREPAPADMDAPAPEAFVPASAPIQLDQAPQAAPQAKPRARSAPVQAAGGMIALDDEDASARIARAPVATRPARPAEPARAPIAIHEDSAATARVRRAPVKTSGGDRV